MSGKSVKDYIPIFDDLGIKNVVAASKNGLGMQFLKIAMPSTGVISLIENGLGEMANTDYGIFIQNQTDVADPGTAVADTVDQITVTGPDTGDILDILIVGKLKGQVG